MNPISSLATTTSPPRTGSSGRRSLPQTDGGDKISLRDLSESITPPSRPTGKPPTPLASPTVYQSASGSTHNQELSHLANGSQATVQPMQFPSSNQSPPHVSRAMFFVQNNLVFSFFVFMTVPLLFGLLLLFFPGFARLLNRYWFGIFKRPLPGNPELYFDVNCINSMNLEDFLTEDQVERCRAIRPFNRVGPPTRFSRRR